jgi:hypothetical protein
MTAATLTSHRPLRRWTYATLALGSLAAAIVLMLRLDTGYWQIFAGGLGPDVALFLGVGRGLERGQLHPRAVRLYNALHGIWLPAALAATALLGLLPSGYLVAALAWGFHVSLDGAVGYGLRTRDGFQRA